MKDEYISLLINAGLLVSEFAIFVDLPYYNGFLAKPLIYFITEVKATDHVLANEKPSSYDLFNDYVSLLVYRSRVLVKLSSFKYKL